MPNKRKLLQNSVERMYTVRQAMLAIKEQIEREAEQKLIDALAESKETKNRQED